MKKTYILAALAVLAVSCQINPDLEQEVPQGVTCHKSQGGQWKCVFIDCPFWMPEQSPDDLKWLYTALTRAVEKVYLVNFPDRFFV